MTFETETVKPEALTADGVWIAEAVLDAANKYMLTQYGNGALGHPVDRQRILASLSPPAGGVEYVVVGEFIASSEHGVGVRWGDLGPLASGDKIYARTPSLPEAE